MWAGAWSTLTNAELWTFHFKNRSLFPEGQRLLLECEWVPCLSDSADGPGVTSITQHYQVIAESWLALTAIKTLMEIDNAVKILVKCGVTCLVQPTAFHKRHSLKLGSELRNKDGDRGKEQQWTLSSLFTEGGWIHWMVERSMKTPFLLPKGLEKNRSSCV